MGPATGLHNAVAARDEHEKHGHREGNDQPPVIDMEDQTESWHHPRHAQYVYRAACRSIPLLNGADPPFPQQTETPIEQAQRYPRWLPPRAAKTFVERLATGPGLVYLCLDGVPGNGQNAVTGQQPAGRSSRYPRATARSEDHVQPANATFGGTSKSG